MSKKSRRRNKILAAVALGILFRLLDFFDMS